MDAAGAGAPFLTARWESLVFLNYACPPRLLEPLVPAGTELDAWQGETLVSLVGFLFTDTRLKGIAIPWHRTFEEVNLRFYVRRTTPDGRAAAGRGLHPRAGAEGGHRHGGAMDLQRAVSDRADVARDRPRRHDRRHRRLRLDLRRRRLSPRRNRQAGRPHHWPRAARPSSSPSTTGAIPASATAARWSTASNTRPGRSGPARRAPSPARPSALRRRFAAVLSRPPQSAFVAIGSEVAVHAGKRVA